ncbi:MAG: GIY-YIG nuclease family protein [Planctomycetota bacterium]
MSTVDSVECVAAWGQRQLDYAKANGLARYSPMFPGARGVWEADTRTEIKKYRKRLRNLSGTLLGTTPTAMVDSAAERLPDWPPPVDYRGCVYVVAMHSMGNIETIKVGHTKHHPLRRMAALQQGVPWSLSLIAAAWGGTTDERAIHEAMDDYRLCGEWFWVPHFTSRGPLDCFKIMEARTVDDVLCAYAEDAEYRAKARN